MKTIFCFIFLCFAFFLKAQPNLVPNGSFESLQFCPNDTNQKLLKSWYSPNGNTPDHYTSLISTWSLCNPFLSWMIASCNWGYNGHGYRLPHSGQGYAGLFTAGSYSDTLTNSEYLAIRLADSLIDGKKYLVSFWVNMGSDTHYAIDAIGVKFQHDSIFDSFSYLNCCFTPDVENQSGNILLDSSSWTLVQDTFIANGGEHFLVIGHLRANNETTYFPIDTVNQGNNRAAYYYIDDVSVIDCDSLVGVPEYARSSFSLYPNPSSGNFNLKGDFPANAQLHVFNLLGEEMNSPIELPQGNQSFPFSVNLAEGIYVCRIIAAGEILHEEKLVVVR